MELNKKQIQAITAFGIVLVVYNIIAFVIPFRHGGPFWVGYGFGLLAILAIVPICLIAFQGAESPRSKFYGMPIARVGVGYLAAQLVVSLLAMALGFLNGCPAWPFVLVSLLLLAAAALGTIAADATRDEITRQDEVLKKDVTNMRALQSLSQSLVSQCGNKQIIGNLQTLAEELRFSDPVSSEATADTEAELASLLDELQRALLENDSSGTYGLCARARAVLAERNRICKLNKHR